MTTAPTPAGLDLHSSLGRADLAMQLALRSVMTGVIGRSHEIQLGRYRIRERLGHGGCGLVLLAEDPELDREVAIKVVLPTRVHEGSSSKWQAALQREARALARLRHPNVVEVFDAGTTDYFDEDTGEQQLGVYLVMERLRGRTLRQWLAKQPRSWREIVDVHVQAARGLIAAHGAGIVHRDFKPDNVLLTDDGRVVLIDFGLADEARELEESASLDVSDSHHGGDLSVTRKSRIVGTPLFMAPEQHLGRDVGPAADQYAWCVSLFCALYGRQPFAGDSMDEIVAHKFRGKLPAVSGTAPRALYRVLARGLRVEPRSRHADLAALLRATLRATAGVRRFSPVLAAGALASATAAAFVIGRPQHPCDDTPLSWSSTWSNEERERVATTLAGLDDPNADAMAARVLEHVDRHGRRWQAAYDQVCGREGAGEHVVAQLECLDRELTQVEHVGGALAALTAADLAQASPLLDGLRQPTECLVAEHDEARSPEAQAELAELWRRMDEVNVQVDAKGQLDDPAWAVAALERADQLGDAALASTIAWRLGQVARSAGRLEEGAAHMHTAVFRAAAAHDYSRALRLMPLLMLAVGSDLGKRDEAESLFEHAKVMGEHLEDSREQVTDCEMSLAYIAIESGEKARALEIYQRALATYESLPELAREQPRVRLALAGAAIEDRDYPRATTMLAKAREELDQLSLPTDLNYATISYLEGGIADKQEDREGAIRGYAKAVDHLRVRLHGHPFVGVGLCGLASAQVDADRIDEALASITEARELAVTAYGQAHADTIRYELTLADVSWRAGRFADSAKAIDRALEGLDALPERQDEFLADARIAGAWGAWAMGDIGRMQVMVDAAHRVRTGDGVSNAEYARSVRRLDAALAIAKGDATSALTAIARPIVTSLDEKSYDAELERRLDDVMRVLAGDTSVRMPDAQGLVTRRASYFEAFVRGTKAAQRARAHDVVAASTAAGTR